MYSFAIVYIEQISLLQNSTKQKNSHFKVNNKTQKQNTKKNCLKKREILLYCRTQRKYTLMYIIPITIFNLHICINGGALDSVSLSTL